ncbi:UDP-N-acetylmuramoyl-L-alanine--D-glutamate ligase [Idiomarina loihiensis]|jgi:UDP-N-acetylmuramoylalanine--D-glutamate ligase|uniref:UDP-N-acetylmuramoyl-L-alanine--D-glutamate ligase n=1 Tax=Idiomarina TaxID=135575 RepID=UPI000552638C|nr:MULTISPECIES: UDP-N-acetylmuramoyl-L-alanine--D-glutamate ligase [Idiomarina]NWO01667.1 UDP-N-acetylmuramoyl-L-alanine--D-glutamate ligase [Idiomarinaceae bacterium]MAA61693.1 UDP-N-acetylmuramoyl-L-alanine--D-glutamate ligase [Idiomarina sp.]MBL4855414.1 UDP-N-acetylmuramoyl-L-alanine--D-glutamate ligase [Idiomarina sp.]MRJ45271.1 UDP-N-acetylmuramoyl-L-alanine--D-glutamate ligase [Idiomarina loihiensis]PHQ92478.1 MAG: UDP-N-acetylmuramoyl-L-alanine--D-glutamate ligase [Idiomarina sp.]|tara:strand:+ start:3628 stop:5019 length:1392 start_codon:yes stop_codon:yes gene_type:complete
MTKIAWQNTKHIVVLGLGKTGVSVLRYLQHKRQQDQKLAEIKIQVFDSRENPPGLEEAKQILGDAELLNRHWELEDTLAADLIIASPGIDLREDPIVLARDADIPIVGDVELFAQESKLPIVAVTGSNGKSTVTRMVEFVAKQCGKNVAAAGNIGVPVLDLLLQEQHPDAVILELSSFQLESVSSLKLKAAALMNISADHMDRYCTLDEYVKAKQRIFTHAKTWILNRQQQDTWPHPVTGKLMTFGNDSHPKHFGLLSGNIDRVSGPVAVTFDGSVVLRADQLQLQGIHNLVNVQAALALCQAIDIDIEAAVRAVKEFKGLPHRCELVSDNEGVLWVNDSKATNIGATAAAVEGLRPMINGRLLLIAGGVGKGADFRELQSTLERVDILLTIGEDGPRIGQLFNGSRQVKSLQQAVELAASLVQTGDMVLLSPACASFDQFQNFEHRGDSFRHAVEALYVNSA